MEKWSGEMSERIIARRENSSLFVHESWWNAGK